MNPRVRFASREDNTRYLFDGSRRQSGGKVISQVALRQWLQDSCSIGMPTICSKQPEEESWSRGVSAFCCLFVIRMNGRSIVSVICMNGRSVVSLLFAWMSVLLSLRYSHERKYYCLFVIRMEESTTVSLLFAWKTFYCLFVIHTKERPIVSLLFA